MKTKRSVTKFSTWCDRNMFMKVSEFITASGTLERLLRQKKSTTTN